MSTDTLFSAGGEAEAVPSLTIRRPDDWHVHLRDGAMLQAVLPFTANQFKRAIIMPNLVPPVTTVEMARAYRERILAARPEGSDFEPLMTCYLTDHTDADEIERGYRDGVWLAAKLYPAGPPPTRMPASRTSQPSPRPGAHGAHRHGGAGARRGDRSRDRHLRPRGGLHGGRDAPLLRRHEGLKVVVEHATTAETVDLVREHASRAACTVTPHHLVINRTSIFQGGLRPHLYCLPVAKRERHRLALRKAVTSGEACFMLGTDTAPHRRGAKEAECCSAGVFGGATALQTYVQVFDEEGALDRFEAFASLNGARFHGLPVNDGTITLLKKPATALAAVSVEEEDVVVFRGGEPLPWSVGDISA